MDVPDASGLGWWVCGPAEYTVEILPKRGPTGYGFVYGLLLASGLVKIGRTRKPRERIYNIRSFLKVYGAPGLEIVAMSHPTAHHVEIEARLHSHFEDRHAGGELYRVTLSEVANVIADRKMIVCPTKQRRGRQPHAWFRKDRGLWYTEMQGKQTCLGRTEEEAQSQLAILLMTSGRWDGRQCPAPDTTGPATLIPPEEDNG